MNRKISFVDAEKNKVNLELEINKGRFSVSGDMGNGCGQIVDSIKPRTDNQKKLIELWNKWHLNDMKAGTEKQEEALNSKEFEVSRGKNDHYTSAVAFLKKKRLYTDKGYKYGSKWLKRDLPENFEIDLNTLLDTIEKEEEQLKEEYKEKNITWEDVQKEHGNYGTALAIHLELSPAEALDSIESRGNNDFSCQGIEYFVGKEEEAAKEYLLGDDGYLWRVAVAAKSTELGLEEWAKWVVSQDSPELYLNSWNGSREDIDSEAIDKYGVEFICRR